MRKLKLGMRKERGQILILVLLVVVVSLAVGLSVASRNISNLKTSTQAEQSQRAFTAAEGGVEDVLSKLNTVANVINVGGAAQAGCTKNTTDANVKQADCTLQNASTTTGVSGTVNVVASTSITKTVDTGDVAQVNLKNFPAGGTFDVEWGKADEINPKPSLEFTFICTNSTDTLCGINPGGGVVSTSKASGSYGQHRLAYQAETIPGQSGFTVCTASSYACKVTFTIPPTGANYAGLELLRMKPFWGRATIVVTPTGAQAANFPVQTYSITSVATTDTGVSRKVQVSRDALPQLPAVFDYVLYSGSDIIK